MAKFEKLNLECVDARFEDNNQKVTLTFLHEDKGEVRDVSLNKGIFDQKTKKFVYDEKKAAQVDEWCEEYFGLPFERMGEAIGEWKEIYCYPNFNSLWEVQMIEKFGDDMEGQIFETEIVKAFDDGKKISLQFEYENGLYESKMQYADFLEGRNEWFVNPQKRKKQYEKFEEKFGLLVGEIEQMVGKKVMVEVKKAFGEFIYNEIKPFKKKPAAKGRKTS